MDNAIANGWCLCCFFCHIPHLFTITIPCLIRLSTVRIVPITTVHAKNATFKGPFARHIVFNGKSNIVDLLAPHDMNKHWNTHFCSIFSTPYLQFPHEFELSTATQKKIWEHLQVPILSIPHENGIPMNPTIDDLHTIWHHSLFISS